MERQHDKNLTNLITITDDVMKSIRFLSQLSGQKFVMFKHVAVVSGNSLAVF